MGINLSLLDRTLEAQATHPCEDEPERERGGESAVAPQAMIANRNPDNPTHAGEPVFES